MRKRVGPLRLRYKRERSEGFAPSASGLCGLPLASDYCERGPDGVSLGRFARGWNERWGSIRLSRASQAVINP